jgi:hypothetical protein
MTICRQIRGLKPSSGLKVSYCHFFSSAKRLMEQLFDILHCWCTKKCQYSFQLNPKKHTVIYFLLLNSYNTPTIFGRTLKLGLPRFFMNRKLSSKMTDSNSKFWFHWHRNSSCEPDVCSQAEVQYIYLPDSLSTSHLVVWGGAGGAVFGRFRGLIERRLPITALFKFLDSFCGFRFRVDSEFFCF